MDISVRASERFRGAVRQVQLAAMLTPVDPAATRGRGASTQWCLNPMSGAPPEP